MQVCVMEILALGSERRVLEWMGDNLRESDQLEMLGMSGTTRLEAGRKLARDVDDVLASGGRVWLAMVDSEPAAIFGARPVSHLADAAEIFMLATKVVERWPVAFARWSRRGLEMIREGLPDVQSFYNWVPAGNQRLREWLGWLGAWYATGGGWPSPWTGERFVRFVIGGERESADGTDGMDGMDGGERVCEVRHV